MNGRFTTLRAGHLIDRQPRVIERGLVGVDRCSFRIVDNDHLGDHVGNPAELALLLTELFLCLLAVLDVSAGGVPPYDVAALVTQRLGADEKPAKHSILPTKARLDLTRLSGDERLVKPLH